MSGGMTELPQARTPLEATVSRELYQRLWLPSRCWRPALWVNRLLTRMR